MNHIPIIIVNIKAHLFLEIKLEQETFITGMLKLNSGLPFIFCTIFANETELLPHNEYRFTKYSLKKKSQKPVTICAL